MLVFIHGYFMEAKNITLHVEKVDYCFDQEQTQPLEHAELQSISTRRKPEACSGVCALCVWPAGFKIVTGKLIVSAELQ